MKMKIYWTKKEVQQYGIIVAVISFIAGTTGVFFVQKLLELGVEIPKPNLIFNWMFCGIAFCTGLVFGAFITAGMIELLKKKGIIK